MDFRALIGMLGGSCFAEEYCDHWEELEQALHQEESSTTDRDADQRLLLILCRAIFESLKGHLKEAILLLDAYLNSEEGPPSPWKFRFQVWGLFFISLRRFPPLARFRPEHGGVWAARRTQDLQYRQICEDLNAVLTQYQPGPGDTGVQKFEGVVLQHLMCISLVLGTDCFVQHQAYPVGIWNADVTAAAARVTGLNNFTRQFRSVVSGLGFDGLAGYLEMIEIERTCAQNANASMDSLRAYSSSYEEYQDYARAGRAKMLEADLIIAPPFSSPVVLNLLPVDTTDFGTNNLTWNTTEDRLTLAGHPEAFQIYDEAVKLFRRGSSNRGEAAVLLRLGCLDHLRGYLSEYNYVESQQAFESARQKFEAASQLFGLDAANGQIVKAHQILLRISTGDFTNLRQDAALIGHWGTNHWNEGIPQMLGWLMIRFGRRQLVTNSRMDTALLCYRCAGSLFAALDDQLSLFQANAAEMQLQNNWSNHTAARSLIDQQLPVFRSRIHSMREAARAHADPYFLLLERANLIITYGSLMSQVFRNAGDTVALQNWSQERRNLYNDPETLAAIGRAADNPYIREHVLGDPLVAEGRGAHPKYEHIDQSLFDSFHTVHFEFSAALQHNDIERAQRSVRNFIADTEGNQDASRYAKTLVQLYSLFLLGDTDGTKILLEALPDDLLFDIRTKTIAQLDKVWWRPRYTTVFKSPDSCDTAIACCALAHDWIRGHGILQLFIRIHPEYLDPEHGERTEDPWSRLTWAGLIEEQTGHYEDAFRHLLFAAKLVETRRSRGINVDARTSSLAVRSTAELFASLARMCLQCRDAGVPLQILRDLDHGHHLATSWKEHAILFLGQGNARSIIEQISLRNHNPVTSLAQINLAYRFRRRTQLLALSEQSRSAEEVAELSNLEAILVGEDDLQLDSKASFDVGFDFDLSDAYKSIAPSAVVLQIHFSRYGTTQFAVTSGGIEYCQNISIRDVDIRWHVMDVMKQLQFYGDNFEGQATLMENLGHISKLLLEPVSSILDGKTHVAFVTSSPMTAFPFSALLYKGQPLCITKAVSQLPSLMALSQLSTGSSEKLKHDTPIKVSVIVKANGTKTEEGFVLERALPMAGIEALTAGHLFTTYPKDGSNMTRSQFQDEFSAADIMILCTHGNLDRRSPVLSHISLREKLRIIDIIQTQASPSLIIFAACLSGLGSATAANDVTGFANALLSTGCKAFIGALWEVNDISTMVLLTIFYKKLKIEMDGDGEESLDEVFASAQRELYQLTEKTAKETVQGLIGIWDDWVSQGKRPVDLVKRGRKHLEITLKALGEIDWKLPFHFAGMALNGWGGIKVRDLRLT